MKRAIATLLLITVVITGAFAATDVDLALNLKNNFFNFGFEIDKEAKFNTPKIGIDLDGTFVFDKHNGFYLDLGYNMEEGNAFTIASGYAYTDPLSSTMDMILKVGPHFIIQSNSLEIGMDFIADFKMDITQKMFFRFGGGIDMNFVNIQKNNSEGYFKADFVIPRVAIGWDF